MKKRHPVLLTLLCTMLLLAACGQKPPSVSDQPEQIAPVPEDAAADMQLPQPPAPADINWISALEPAPAAPEGFAIAEVLEYLCSTAFGGRQTGTEGCAAAVDYAAGFLEDWGYQPLFGDNLAVPYTAMVGDPALAEAEVILHLPGGDVILTEGVDYTYTFHPQDIDATLPVSKDPRKCLIGEAAYLWSSGGSGGARILLRKAGGMLSAGSDVLGMGDKKLPDRRIVLSDSAFAVAEQATHVTLRMKASARELERENICAVLPGADRTRAMVLCAHIDGTGTWGEILYPSAHDNASGTVTLLECARQLAGECLPFDLVICVFSGEEQSMLGSEALAPALEAHYELLNVINLDCLGCGVEDSVNLLAEDGAPLAAALWPYLQQAGYTAYTQLDGGSDHVSFTHPAIGLGELYEGDNRWHRPDDTVDAVDPVWLQRIADAICAYVQEQDLLPITACDG